MLEARAPTRTFPLATILTTLGASVEPWALRVAVTCAPSKSAAVEGSRS
jgi:hypothetical protein